MQHAFAVVVRSRSYDLYVPVDEVLRVVARRSEVKQIDLVRIPVEEEVRPIWVGLHDVPHEELVKAQAQYVFTNLELLRN